MINYLWKINYFNINNFKLLISINYFICLIYNLYNYDNKTNYLLQKIRFYKFWRWCYFPKSIFTVHFSDFKKKIKDLGFQAGLAIKPQTKTSQLDKYLDLIDLVLVMSVEPGFGGQTFINNTYQKINEIKSKKQNILIEVDGGINNTNINTIKNTADIAVVGSYITNKEDYNEAINTLKN